MDKSLIHKKCVPCEGGTTPLSQDEIDKYRLQLNLAWIFDKNLSMNFSFRFEDFPKAMIFVNQVADIAKSEDHHPDICISYSKVNITLTTHNIGGLSVNDFIVAVKIEALVPKK